MKAARCAASRHAADLLHESGCAMSLPRTRASARHGYRAFALLAWALAASAVGQAATGVFSISSATIDAGGNRVSGGGFGIEGSIAQPVAGAALAGGSYNMDSGFQSLDDDLIFGSDFE